MQLKAVLFDIDGTLVDSNHLHVTAWDEVFRDAGYEFDRATLHRHIGKGGDNYVPSLLPHSSEEEQERLRDAHKQLFTGRYIKQAQPFPGARELLRKVSESGLKVVLATSASAEELRTHVETLGAADLIDEDTNKDDVEESKPAPDVFAAALEKAGVEASEALVVGDTPYDLEAARGCGVDSIAVRSGGFSDEQLKGAIAIYDSVAELLKGYESSPISRRLSSSSGGS